MSDKAKQDARRRADDEWMRKHEKPPTWGDIYWKWRRRGVDHADAAFRADEWERKRLDEIGPARIRSAI